MKTEASFALSLQGYSVHRLSVADIAAMQRVFEQCQDYMLLVDGQPAGQNAAEEDFYSVPPGRSPDEKTIFGIFNGQSEMIGLLDALSAYPDESTWWIGLLLLLPETRSQGIGQKIVNGFVEYVRGMGARAIMLGVVEDNKPAYQFWIRMGFEWVCKTEPRQFGIKVQAVNVMRLTLADVK